MTRDARTWHVSVDGREEGPLSTTQILQGFRHGRWDGSARVLQEPGDWMPARNVREIRRELRRRRLGPWPAILQAIVGGGWIIGGVTELIAQPSDGDAGAGWGIAVGLIFLMMAVLDAWLFRQEQCAEPTP